MYTLCVSCVYIAGRMRNDCLDNTPVNKIVIILHGSAKPKAKKPPEQRPILKCMSIHISFSWLKLGCGFIPGCEKCSDGLICNKCRPIFTPVEYERNKKKIIRCSRSCPPGYNVTSTREYPKICVRTQFGKLNQRHTNIISWASNNFLQSGLSDITWAQRRWCIYIKRGYHVLSVCVSFLAVQVVVIVVQFLLLKRWIKWAVKLLHYYRLVKYTG